MNYKQLKIRKLSKPAMVILAGFITFGTVVQAEPHQEKSSTKEGSPSSAISEKTFKTDSRPRVIVTSDGEIDDQASMIRFLLYANECDVEAIVLSSSQYHSYHL